MARYLHEVFSFCHFCHWLRTSYCTDEFYVLLLQIQTSLYGLCKLIVRSFRYSNSLTQALGIERWPAVRRHFVGIVQDRFATGSGRWEHPWHLSNCTVLRQIPEHAQTKRCSTPDYMNLYFKVKGFYFKYIAEMPQYRQSIPEFPACVLLCFLKIL